MRNRFKTRRDVRLTIKHFFMLVKSPNLSGIFNLQGRQSKTSREKNIFQIRLSPFQACYFLGVIPCIWLFDVLFAHFVPNLREIFCSFSLQGRFSLAFRACNLTRSCHLQFTHLYSCRCHTPKLYLVSLQLQSPEGGDSIT